jgi:hypothetical protein
VGFVGMMGGTTDATVARPLPALNLFVESMFLCIILYVGLYPSCFEASQMPIGIPQHIVHRKDRVGFAIGLPFLDQVQDYLVPAAAIGTHFLVIVFAFLRQAIRFVDVIFQASFKGCPILLNRLGGLLWAVVFAVGHIVSLWVKEGVPIWNWMAVGCSVMVEARRALDRRRAAGVGWKKGDQRSSRLGWRMVSFHEDGTGIA